MSGQAKEIEGMWCILRTSGARTLPLLRSLQSDGYDVWTPVQTTMKLVRRGSDEKREVDGPILPTFVFARSHHLQALAAAARDPARSGPTFSIFHWGNRIPLVSAAAIVGLQLAERMAQEALELQRQYDTREARRRARAAAQKTEHARRKALRAVHRQFRIGAAVDIAEMPALAGMSGTVVESKGKSALVAFGKIVMEIEAWRLNPHDVQDEVQPARA